MISIPLPAALDGCTIIIAVDRRSGELTAALERHGAAVRQAPALTIVPHIDDEALVARTAELIANPPDIVVATTGVGLRGWMEAADEAGFADDLHRALSGSRIVARGPKARGAIQQAGFIADWVAESETSSELGAYLVAEGIAGRRIAIQHHGSGADGLDALFAAHGADVVSLTVYRWGPPPDPEPVLRSVAAAAAGDVDAVLFTSAPGAHQWLTAAQGEGALDRILALTARRRLLFAAVGPVTAGPIRAAGISPLIPDRGRLGSLVRCVVGHFGGGGVPALGTASGRLEMRSTGVVLEGRHIPLSRAGCELMGTLFDAAGGVVSRTTLQSALPRSGDSTHAVEMAVARVREALGIADLIKTVLKRGYRLNVVDSPEAGRFT